MEEHNDQENTNGTQPAAAATASAAKRPIKVIRNGAIAASIWVRTSADGYAYYEFTLSRSWKSQGDAGYARAFFDRNEEALCAVVREAAAHIRGLLANGQTVSIEAC